MKTPQIYNRAGLCMLDIIVITSVLLVYFPILDEALTRNNSEHIGAKDPTGIDNIINKSLF